MGFTTKLEGGLFRRFPALLLKTISSHIQTPDGLDNKCAADVPAACVRQGGNYNQQHIAARIAQRRGLRLSVTTYFCDGREARHDLILRAEVIVESWKMGQQ